MCRCLPPPWPTPSYAHMPPPAAASPAVVAALAGASLASAAAPAAHAQDVDGAVASIVDFVTATGDVVKQGVSAAQTGAEYAKAAYEQVWVKPCGWGVLPWMWHMSPLCSLGASQFPRL